VQTTNSRRHSFAAAAEAMRRILNENCWKSFLDRPKVRQQNPPIPDYSLQLPPFLPSSAAGILGDVIPKRGAGLTLGDWSGRPSFVPVNSFEPPKRHDPLRRLWSSFLASISRSI
jgi:hypothetical protein